MSKDQFEAISTVQLDHVVGGGWAGDLWDATRGAVQIVTDPINSTVRGIDGVVRARQQGWDWGNSLANGMAQAPGNQRVPDLGNIPANPNAPQQPRQPNR